jgi:hypothetical protein
VLAVDIDDATSLKRDVQNLEIKNKELILELRRNEDMLTIQYQVL